MNFIETIEHLPNVRLEMLERIAKETHSSKGTVWRWLRGGTVPELKKDIIAKILNKPVAELWPNTSKNHD